MLLEMHVHVWSCLLTQVAIHTEGCSWRMQYMCKVPFGSHCIMPSHCTLNLLLIHHYKAPCIWRGSQMAMNRASLVLSLGFRLKLSQLISKHSALQLAAEHKAEYTDQWKIRAQHSHTIQTSSADQTFSFASLPGLLLCVNQLEGEPHHYCNKSGQAVTLPRHTLHSLTHVTYKQNNDLTNVKCLILHINYFLHQMWVLLNSRSRAEDIKSHFVGLPQHNTTQHKQTVHATHCLTFFSDNTPNQSVTQFPVQIKWIKLLSCNYWNVQVAVPWQQKHSHSLNMDC